MRIRSLQIWAKEKYQKVNWNLLIFLLLFLDVKLVVKIAALCFMYIRKPGFSFRFSRRGIQIPLFYPAMIVIALINFCIFSLYREPQYSLVLVTGIAFWMVCILAVHQVYLGVNNGSLQKIHNALLLFFIINAAASFCNILAIIIETGAINPYRYQGNYQKYFIGTGDYIRGITFDTSTTNAILNAFGVVYFLSRKQMLLSLLCMSVLLLTCSNFTNLLILCCFAGLFIFKSDRDQKSVIVVHIALLVIFMTNVSPQNNKYATSVVERALSRKEAVRKNVVTTIIPIIERPDSTLTNEEKRYKIARLYLDSALRARKLLAARSGLYKNMAVSIPLVPRENIHAPDHQHKQDSSAARLQVIAFLRELHKKQGSDSLTTNTLLYGNKEPGKLIAFEQLARFMEQHPSRVLTGNGIGNFSSKLAFRATGLQIAGGYPAGHTYIGNDFKNNHFSIYLDYFGKDSGFHSITNSPNSFYAQLLGEYGLIGVACFIVYYLLFFTQKLKKLTYGLPILFIMMAAFATEYWFEQLSVVIMFELLLLLNRREVTLIKESNV